MTEEQIERANEFAKSSRHAIPPKMTWRRWGDTHLWIAMGYVKGEGSELTPIIYNTQKDIISFFDTSSGVFVLSEGKFVNYIDKIRNEERKLEQQEKEKAELDTITNLTQQEIDEICDDLLDCLRLETVKPDEISPFEKAVMIKKYGDNWLEEMVTGE